MSIINELQEQRKKNEYYTEVYQKVLKEALIENVIPYLMKSEAKLIQVVKDINIHGQNSLKIIMSISNYPDDDLISWYIDLLHRTVGSLTLNGCIDDYLFEKKFFIFKNQVRCTDIKYKKLLKEIDDNNLSFSTRPILSQIIDDSPSILESIKSYYENQGFRVHIKRDGEKLVLILNWNQ